MKNIIFALLGFIFLTVTACSKKSTAATTAPPAEKQATMSSPSASDAKAVEVLKNYIDAIGGKDKLSGVKSMMMKMSAATGMGDILITQYIKDGKMAMKTEMSGSTVMEQIFDGTSLQVSGMGGTQNITDQGAIKGAKKQARMFDELDQLTSDKSIKKYLGSELIEGKNVHKISITDEDKNETTQYFDATSNYLVRTISTSDAMGQKSTQTMDFNDYKEVNGIKFPHQVKLTGGAVPFPLDMKITALMINSDLPDQLFKIN
ncbi:MAG: hypothetical protein SH818_08485 [Saprospiraceae bacterium]|nr:hypothetical protein [Saprospiraceae bacterium]